MSAEFKPVLDLNTAIACLMAARSAQQALQNVMRTEYGAGVIDGYTTAINMLEGLLNSKLAPKESV